MDYEIVDNPTEGTLFYVFNYFEDDGHIGLTFTNSRLAKLMSDELNAISTKGAYDYGTVIDVETSLTF